MLKELLIDFFLLSLDAPEVFRADPFFRVLHEVAEYSLLFPIWQYTENIYYNNKKVLIWFKSLSVNFKNYIGRISISSGHELLIAIKNHPELGLKFRLEQRVAEQRTDKKMFICRFTM